MKKFLSLAIILVLALALVACGAQPNGETTTATQTTTEQTTIENEYFSPVWVDSQNVPNATMLHDEAGFPTHVSLLPVLQMLGTAIEVNNGVVIMSGLDQRQITFDVGSNVFSVDGETIELNNHAVEVDDAIYVPVMFFRNIFGAGSAAMMGGEVHIGTHATDDMF